MQSANGSKSTPVTFRFKNIGPVKEAEMELGDLTIIAGRNNTGKTYLAYTLYGFLKTWRELAASVPPGFDHLVSMVIETGHAEQSIDQESFNSEREAMIQRLTQDFSEKVLSDVFSCSDETFESASFEIILNDAFPLAGQSKKEGNFSITYDGRNIVIEQEDFLKNDASLGTLEKNKYLNNMGRTMQIIHYLYVSFLSPNFPYPFILSAERFGISLFYKELDFTKSRLVEALQKLSEDREGAINPLFFLDESSARYALPIKDNIDYTRSLGDFRRQKSEIYGDKLFNDIRDMMDGYYSNTGDNIEFRSTARGKRKFIIPLHIASSSARGLSDLYFYLRYVAQKNHLLIIDEPESHLDTANQIQLARLLARFIQAGLKILITTHSDYLIKEINNLIMLSKSFDKKEEIVQKLGYKEDDLLEPDSVRAYVAEEDGLSECEVDDFGIDMPVFDETIDKINRVSNELASRLAAEDRQT